MIALYELAPADAGQLIHGTLRDEDLIPAFGAKLRELQEQADQEREELNKILARHYELANEAEEWTNDDSPVLYPEGVGELTNDLIDALNEYAPEGFYFGAIEGDGSDFGFWPDELDQDARDELANRILRDVARLTEDGQVPENVGTLITQLAQEEANIDG